MTAAFAWNPSSVCADCVAIEYTQQKRLGCIAQGLSSRNRTRSVGSNHQERHNGPMLKGFTQSSVKPKNDQADWLRQTATFI